MTALRYTILPARAHPARAVLGATIIVLVEAVMLLVEKSLFFAALAGFLLLATTSPFFFPTTVELDADGVRVRHLGAVRARPWSQIRSAVLRPAGVLFSPFATRSLLDGPRGVFARYGTPAERDELLARVKEKLPCR